MKSTPATTAGKYPPKVLDISRCCCSVNNLFKKANVVKPVLRTLRNEKIQLSRFVFIGENTRKQCLCAHEAFLFSKCNVMYFSSLQHAYICECSSNLCVLLHIYVLFMHKKEFHQLAYGRHPKI